MEAQQGDIYWIDSDDPIGSEPGYRRPYVVVQNNALNRTQINTVIMCVLTTNLKWASFPGNVYLDQGEAGLVQSSVVNVTQIYTVDKTDLEERIGKVSPRRVRQILNGIRLVLDPRDVARNE